jgi:NitT/TauT family transport system substrate-binding protein
LRAILGITALVLVATGCADRETDATASALTELRVGLLPIVDVAPVHLAIERGLFAEQGLSVTIEVVQGGAAAIPALVGGDLDIAYGAWPSFLLANQEGIDLRAIADGVAAGPGFTEFLALPESGLEGRPEGMAGALVAVNTLNNIGELAVRSTLRDAGVDPSDVQLVEIPFPDMGASLERGDVDVIWASEPIPTIVKADLGAVVVADSFVGEMESFPVAGYQTTAAFAEGNPDAVSAFQRALAAAAELIAGDPSIAIDIVPSYTGLSSDLAGEIALPVYGGRIEAATLQRVNDYLVEFEILEPGLVVEDLVLAEPPGG